MSIQTFTDIGRCINREIFQQLEWIVSGDYNYSMLEMYPRLMQVLSMKPEIVALRRSKTMYTIPDTNEQGFLWALGHGDEDWHPLHQIVISRTPFFALLKFELLLDQYPITSLTPAVDYLMDLGFITHEIDYSEISGTDIGSLYFEMGTHERERAMVGNPHQIDEMKTDLEKVLTKEFTNPRNSRILPKLRKIIVAAGFGWYSAGYVPIIEL